MLLSSEGPLVDSQYGTIDGASVLYVLQTVNEERNNGSNGTKEETEHGGNEKSHVSVLVDNHGGHLVTLGAHGYHWGLPKHMSLQWGWS